MTAESVDRDGRPCGGGAEAVWPCGPRTAVNAGPPAPAEALIGTG